MAARGRPRSRPRTGSCCAGRPFDLLCLGMTHFQVVTLDGEALGPIELDGSDWSPGNLICADGLGTSGS